MRDGRATRLHPAVHFRPVWLHRSRTPTKKKGICAGPDAVPMNTRAVFRHSFLENLSPRGSFHLGGVLDIASGPGAAAQRRAAVVFPHHRDLSRRIGATGLQRGEPAGAHRRAQCEDARLCAGTGAGTHGARRCRDRRDAGDAGGRASRPGRASLAENPRGAHPLHCPARRGPGFPPRSRRQDRPRWSAVGGPSPALAFRPRAFRADRQRPVLA